MSQRHPRPRALLHGLCVACSTFLAIAFTVGGRSPAIAANAADFEKPEYGVSAVSGRRPLLVVLLAPATTTLPTRRDVYVLQPDGTIGLTMFDVDYQTGAPSGWHAGASYTGIPAGPGFAAAPAVLDSPDGGLRSVFALGRDGRVYQTYVPRVFKTAGASPLSWTPWRALPAGVRLVSAPAALNSPDGKVASVFATGDDGRVYQSVYARGTSSAWGAWTPLPGSERFSSGPAALNSPDGKVASVFATGTNGHVYQITYARRPGGHWGAWTMLPGSTTFKSSPATLNSPDGKVASVFATGNDGRVYQCVYFRRPGGHWGTWTLLDGSQSFSSAPSVFNAVEGSFVELYATATDGYVHRRLYKRVPGAKWGPWTKVTPDLRTGAAPAALESLQFLPSREVVRQRFFGATNSVQSYYLDVSYGRFTFDEALTTPWVTARDDPSTPNQDESSWLFLNTSDIQKKGAYVLRQVEEQKLLRFAQYDSNPHNGVVTSDELSVLWIYPGDAQGNRRGTDPATVPVPSTGGDSHPERGVRLGGLVRAGSHSQAYVLAHELGHLPLQLDDLYDDKKKGFIGVRTFSLMGKPSSGVALPHLDPWSRIKLGWLEPRVVQQDGWVTLGAVEDKPLAYILHDPQRGSGTDEYFIVENRWPGTSSEAGLPDRGLAVWHIDNGRTAATGSWGRDVIRLVWAQGEGNESQALFDGSDPATGYDLDDTSSPANLRWYDGTKSGIAIRNISPAGPTMRVWFDVP